MDDLRLFINRAPVTPGNCLATASTNGGLVRTDIISVLPAVGLSPTLER